MFIFFFFQAEDGIRDVAVTGVQTCALPISLRQEQLSREDLRELAHVSDLGTMETLMQLLAERSAQQLVYSSLAREIQVSVDTVKRWVDLVARLHHGFLVRPWFTRSEEHTSEL